MFKLLYILFFVLFFIFSCSEKKETSQSLQCTDALNNKNYVIIDSNLDLNSNKEKILFTINKLIK